MSSQLEDAFNEAVERRVAEIRAQDVAPFFTEQQERALSRCEGYDEGFAAGRSAERARLAEIDVMAFGKATCARFTYAEDQPYEAVGDRDSLRLRAFLDAYLRAALSEGTPDKEDTDA